MKENQRQKLKKNCHFNLTPIDVEIQKNPLRTSHFVSTRVTNTFVIKTRVKK